ncbi:hypothetical protein [Janthinobacterium sp. HLX7-2]|uniref:hypothetical protein n=1 Tax=Janthinobacterium sp. HLX7-2 TaxID=1259331 RepID=UPI003F1FB206
MADYRRRRLRLSIAFGAAAACKVATRWRQEKTAAHVCLPLTSGIYQQYFIGNTAAVPVRVGARVLPVAPCPPFCPSSQELFTMLNSQETLHMPLKSAAQHARVDQKMCDIINLGIAVQAAFSTLCALEYLKSYNIDPELIERVLLHPEQCRQVLD